MPPVVVKLYEAGDVPADIIEQLPQGVDVAARDVKMHSYVTLYGVLSPASTESDDCDGMDNDDVDAESAHISALQIFHAVACEPICHPTVQTPLPTTPQLRAHALAFLTALLSPLTPHPTLISRVLLNALLSSTPLHLVTPPPPPLLTTLTTHLLHTTLFPGNNIPDTTLPLSRPTVTGTPLSPIILPPGSLLLSLQAELHAEMEGGIEYDLGVYRMKYPSMGTVITAGCTGVQGVINISLPGNGGAGAGAPDAADVAGFKGLLEVVKGGLRGLSEEETGLLTEEFVRRRQMGGNGGRKVEKEDLEGWCWMWRGEVYGGVGREGVEVWEEAREKGVGFGH